MRTTSRPPRRSTRSSGNLARGSPLKSIRLTITLAGAGAEELKRLAAEKGLTTEARGGGVMVVIKVATPEEALAQMRLLAGVLAKKS